VSVTPLDIFDIKNASLRVNTNFFRINYLSAALNNSLHLFQKEVESNVEK
jgi:hypothetical protein